MTANTTTKTPANAVDSGDKERARVAVNDRAPTPGGKS
jgi:hypothetical protein